MNPNINVIKDVSKINSSKSKVDNIIDDLKDLNNLMLNDFEGNMKFEIVERMNQLINRCYDLEIEFVTMKNTLMTLSMDILDETKRLEDLKKQKELTNKVGPVIK